MKKLLCFIMSGFLIANLSALTYTAEIVNNSGTDLWLECSGNKKSLPSDNKSHQIKLDISIACNIKYKEIYLFTIKEDPHDPSFYVIQHTPIARSNGVLNSTVQIYLNGNKENKGSFETTLNALERQFFDGFCHYDDDGVTCHLAQSNAIKKINIAIDKVKD